ncbi:putative holin [Pseudomonas sp. p106]|uniref:putative holin n=1 Tax=Pseudomonas sp. p106 TaxID=2479854 RepID=UPI000F77E6B5|nr:putative holin [Pseudomonas sp. p106]RRV49566.1 hypothetical protein EGJ09_01120 [Pseudomonas sp. p106]
MADAFTTAATAAAAPLAVGGTGITIAAMFPGVDLSAVIGAFGGAFFFVLFAKDISNWQRIGYLIVGWIGGYFGAAEFLAQAWTKTSGIASFIAGLLCIVISMSLVESIQTGKPPRWAQFVWGLLARRGQQ